MQSGWTWAEDATFYKQTDTAAPCPFGLEKDKTFEEDKLDEEIKKQTNKIKIE